MEPMVLSSEAEVRPRLTELVLELTKRSTAFRSRLPKGLADPLADLVRSMNCYYSNLIEGHNTHPVDIERALHDDLSEDPKKRDLQLEAKAHIAVQKWIDEGGLKGRELTEAGLRETHRRFIALLPEKLCWVENPQTRERIRVVPGGLRDRDVQVGRHRAVSPGAVPRFMRRFETCYTGLGTLELLLASGPTHHRLLWIHPFADGNGRVARLMSHATLLKTLDSGALWSVARGLARRDQDYKKHLAACDMVRRGDRDGRGHLSEAATISFAEFFLDACLDQVRFMEALMQPRAFRDRVLKWAEEEIHYKALPANSSRVLDAILFRGSLPRSEVATVLDQSARTATNITNALSRQGIIFAPGARADWQIALPAKLAPRLMPGLFPDPGKSAE